MANPRAFSLLMGLALMIAVMGLLGNLANLHSLMMFQHNDLLLPNDFLTHYYYNNMHQSSLTTSSVSSSILLLSDEQVFRRMLQQTIVNLETCNGGDGNIVQNNDYHPVEQNQHLTSTTMNRSRLARFGFLNALTNHLSISSIESSSSISSSSGQCHYPPPTACQAQEYSMLVTSQGVSGWRILFLNLLSWLTYSSVSNIYVIFVTNHRATLLQSLKDDVKYGRRLVSWHVDPTHKVQLILVNTLWEGLANITTTTTAMSDAVLFMDGDVTWEGNQRGVEVGWELWKRHSQSLIATQGWHVTSVSQDVPSIRRRRLQIENASQVVDDGSDGDSSLFAPVCKDEYLLTAIPTTNKDLELVDMSGLFVHVNFLCFLQHSVGQSLQRYASSASSSSSSSSLLTQQYAGNDERVAISVWLTQLSGLPPRLYPSKIPLDENKMARVTTANHNKKEHGKQTMSTSWNTTDNPSDLVETRTESSGNGTGSNLRSRRTKNRSSTPETKKKAGGKRILTGKVIRTLRRQLLQDKDSFGGERSLDYEVLTAIVGYFGSLPRESIEYCSEVGLVSTVQGTSSLCGPTWIDDICNLKKTGS